MKRHNNPKVPFGADTGPPVIDEGHFMQSNNDWISKSGIVANSGLVNHKDSAQTNGVMNVRQSQNSEGIQSVDSSMENPDAYLQGPNALLNLDISASNFMKAMNFEAMNGSDENDEEHGEFEAECDNLQGQYDDQPCLEQHSMDMSIEIQNDLAEQQQAIEQAKLLHRFKQFREWQQQQQDLLMAQQQQQLLQLRGEQERVQRMIAQQRQMQWGGTNQKQENGVRSPAKTMNAATKMASPRRSDQRLHSTIPQALAQGAVAMANFQAPTDDGSKPVRNLTSTVQIVNGRPAPILPERPPTPEEYMERGNPNLDSDSNTISSRDTANVDDDDGICSIPDNISEPNVHKQRQTNPVASHLANQNGLLNGQGFDSRNLRLPEGLPNVFSQQTQPNAGLFEQAQQMQLHLLSQIAAQNGLAFPNQFISGGNLHNGAFNLPSLNSGQQQPRCLHPGFLQNLVHRGKNGKPMHEPKNFNSTSTQHLPNTQGLEIQDEYVLQRSKLSSTKNRSPPKEKHTRLKPPPEQRNYLDLSDVSTNGLNKTDNQTKKNLVYYLEEDELEIQEKEVVDLEDVEEDGEEEMNEEESAGDEEADNTQVAVDEDERPIEGIGTKKKTFEELLEEELRKEEERMKDGHNLQNDQQHSPDNQGKRPFLRRGEGIARFNKSNSARSRSQKCPSRGQRQLHSAPASGRSENKSKMTSITPTSNPEKNTSGPRKIINTNKPAQKLSTKPQVSSNNSHSGPQKKATGGGNVLNKKPVPPTEPRKVNSRTQLKKVKQTSPKQVASSPPKQNSDMDSIGEISFQKRVKAKAKEEECEADELEEFEILEELADDDVSFISNVSTVNKVVTHLKETKNGSTQETQVKQQIHKPRQASEQQQQQEIKMLHQLQQRKQKQQELAALNAKLKSLSRPVSHAKAEDIKVNSDNKVNGRKDPDSSEKDEGQGQKRTETSDHQVKVIHQRKVVSLAAKSPAKPEHQENGKHSNERTSLVNGDQDELACLQRVISFSDSEGHQSDDEGDDNTDTEQSANNDNDSSDEEENDSFVVRDVHIHAKNHDTNDRNNNENLTAQTQPISMENNNRNNRTSVTTCSDSSRSSNVLEAHSQSNSDRGPSPVSNNLSSSGGSGTLKFDTHNKDSMSHDNKAGMNGSEEPNDVKPYLPSAGFDFGDEEEWGDTSHTDEGNSTLTETDAHQQSAKLRNDEAKRTAVTKTKVQSPTFMNGRTEENSVPLSATPPPTSKLVSRLFPNLKQEANKEQKVEQVVQQQKIEATKQTNGGDGIQSKILRDKLMELETEIERFRSENVALTKLRKEREEGLSKLHKEMEEFEKQKEAELKRLNDFKTEETKKLKKERKLFDQYQKAARAVPDKKEREEIENLKKQVTDLQDEMKRKEQRWTSSTTRLRDRIETLETENRELKEEIKILEKKRLEAWQQEEAEKKSVSTSVTSNPPLKQRDDSRKTALAPTPQQQPPKVSDRDNALRLSSNMEELKAAMGGFSVKELDDSVLSTEAEEYEHSFESKTFSPSKNKEVKAIPRKKAPVFNISNTVDRGDGEFEENTLPDGKVEKVYSNGSREILFPNGTRKQISSDGQSIIVSFFNGDMKQIMPDQRVVYYYSEAQTTHTTYPDGLEILQFPNNQVEKHYPDGTREISFPDHTIKYLFPSGVEESIFEDGTVIRVEKNGDKTMEFPNGQREVHTADYKRREYPDGTVKTVYPDGRQETRYSSGRIRVKDREGNVIVDKRV